MTDNTNKHDKLSPIEEAIIADTLSHDPALIELLLEQADTPAEKAAAEARIAQLQAEAKAQLALEKTKLKIG